jgi:quinol monooxygenase YgiN
MSDIPGVAIFVAKPGAEAKLEVLLKGLVEPTRQEPGCLQYDLHVDIKEPRRFVFIERWANQEALAGHGKTAHIAHFREHGPELIEQKEVDFLRKLPV